MADKMARIATVIWGTFRTIVAIQEYQSYNIVYHPSILGEYIRFLIENWGGKGGDNTRV